MTPPDGLRERARIAATACDLKCACLHNEPCWSNRIANIEALVREFAAEQAREDAVWCRSQAWKPGDSTDVAEIIADMLDRRADTIERGEVEP